MIAPYANKTGTVTSASYSSNASIADMPRHKSPRGFERTQSDAPADNSPRVAATELLASVTSVDVQNSQGVEGERNVSIESEALGRVDEITRRRNVPGLLRCELIEATDEQLTVWASMPTGIKVKTNMPRAIVEAAGMTIRSTMEFGWLPETGEIVKLDVRDQKVIDEIDLLRARRRTSTSPADRC